MNPAQDEAISTLIRLLGTTALTGGAVRAGYGVLRNANRTYDPPEEPKPLIVDMPYAAREAPPAAAIPLPKRMKEQKPPAGMLVSPEKAANDAPAMPTVQPVHGTGAAAFDVTRPLKMNTTAPPEGPGARPFWKQPMFSLPVPHPLAWARDGGMSPGGSFRATPDAKVDLTDVADKVPIGLALSAARTSARAPENHTYLRTVKQNADKAAGLEATIKALPLGESIWNSIPQSTPIAGRPDASGPMEVPAFGLAAPAVAAAGLGGGYMLADKVLRAADRRGSRKDLDAAQEEYRQAILNRITKGQSGKAAADLAKLASGQTPDDANLRRAKTALDRLFAAATARAKAAEDGSSLSLNAIKSFLYPGHLLGPEGATANMAVAGGLGVLGGYAGYNASRDKDEASKVRDRIRALDKLNARKIQAPVVARLVPVAPDKL